MTARMILIGCFCLLLSWADVRTQNNAIEASLLAFLEAIGPKLREKIEFPFDHEERRDWSNLPHSIHPRRGVSMGELDARSMMEAHKLLRTALSSQGYLKATGILTIEEIDRELGGNSRADIVSPEYFFSVMGKPGGSSPWGWQFDGHHLALNFTHIADKFAVTPVLFGASPDIVPKGPYAGWHVLAQERDKGFAVLNALKESQRTRAVLATKVPGDIFTGPQRDKALKKFEGIPASDLDDRQRTLLWTLIDEYLDNQLPEAARAHRAKIEADGNAKLYFAWMGPADHNQSFYYRVHGPSLLIEYDNTGRASPLFAHTNHVHIVYRDPSNDYGEDLLAKHRQQAHRR